MVRLDGCPSVNHADLSGLLAEENCHPIQKTSETNPTKREGTCFLAVAANSGYHHIPCVLKTKIPGDGPWPKRIIFSILTQQGYHLGMSNRSQERGKKNWGQENSKILRCSM